MFVKFVNSIQYFCSKNYSGTYKVRSRLGEFLKHVHPDQLHQAPTKVKEENLRSLKNFNAYIDSINNEKPSQGKLLTFYIAEKTNNKSKKFYSFNIELPEITPSNMSQDKAKKLLDTIVESLNDKFKESRQISNKKGEKGTKAPTKIEIEEPIQTAEERFQRMQATISPFEKNETYKDRLQEEQLKSHIKSKYLKSETENLKIRLHQRMSFADTARNKPLIWSKIMNEQTGHYRDYQAILNGLIDPKLIFFADHLSLHQIQAFKSKMMPGEADRAKVRESHAIHKVCEQMEGESPPLCFFVTDHYSGQDIPGFFSVPFDFKPLELLDNFEKVKPKIVADKQRYEQLHDYHTELLQELASKHNLTVSLPDFRNIPDISEKILLMQRIARVGHVFQEQTELVVFDHDEFKIFCNHYNFDIKKTMHVHRQRIFTLPLFQDQHYKQVIAEIERGEIRREKIQSKQGTENKTKTQNQFQNNSQTESENNHSTNHGSPTPNP